MTFTEALIMFTVLINCAIGIACYYRAHLAKYHAEAVHELLDFLYTTDEDPNMVWSLRSEE